MPKIPPQKNLKKTVMASQTTAFFLPHTLSENSSDVLSKKLAGLGLGVMLSPFLSFLMYGEQVSRTFKYEPSVLIRTLKILFSFSVLISVWSLLYLLNTNSLKNKFLTLFFPTHCFDDEERPLPGECDISSEYHRSGEMLEQLAWGLVASMTANIMHASANITHNILSVGADFIAPEKETILQTLALAVTKDDKFSANLELQKLRVLLDIGYDASQKISPALTEYLNVVHTMREIAEAEKKITVCQYLFHKELEFFIADAADLTTSVRAYSYYFQKAYLFSLKYADAKTRKALVDLYQEFAKEVDVCFFGNISHPEVIAKITEEFKETLSLLNKKDAFDCYPLHAIMTPQFFPMKKLSIEQLAPAGVDSAALLIKLGTIPTVKGRDNKTPLQFLVSTLSKGKEKLPESEKHRLLTIIEYFVKQNLDDITQWPCENQVHFIIALIKLNKLEIARAVKIEFNKFSDAFLSEIRTAYSKFMESTEYSTEAKQNLFITSLHLKLTYKTKLQEAEDLFPPSKTHALFEVCSDFIIRNLPLAEALTHYIKNYISDYCSFISTTLVPSFLSGTLSEENLFRCTSLPLSVLKAEFSAKETLSILQLADKLHSEKLILAAKIIEKIKFRINLDGLLTYIFSQSKDRASYLVILNSLLTPSAFKSFDEALSFTKKIFVSHDDFHDPVVFAVLAKKMRSILESLPNELSYSTKSMVCAGTLPNTELGIVFILFDITLRIIAWRCGQLKDDIFSPYLNPDYYVENVVNTTHFAIELAPLENIFPLPTQISDLTVSFAANTPQKTCYYYLSLLKYAHFHPVLLTKLLENIPSHLQNQINQNDFIEWQNILLRDLETPFSKSNDNPILLGQELSRIFGVSCLINKLLAINPVTLHWPNFLASIENAFSPSLDEKSFTQLLPRIPIVELAAYANVSQNKVMLSLIVDKLVSLFPENSDALIKVLSTDIIRKIVTHEKAPPSTIQKILTSTPYSAYEFEALQWLKMPDLEEKVVLSLLKKVNLTLNQKKDILETSGHFTAFKKFYGTVDLFALHLSTDNKNDFILEKILSISDNNERIACYNKMIKQQPVLMMHFMLRTAKKWKQDFFNFLSSSHYFSFYSSLINHIVSHNLKADHIEIYAYLKMDKIFTQLNFSAQEQLLVWHIEENEPAHFILSRIMKLSAIPEKTEIRDFLQHVSLEGLPNKETFYAKMKSCAKWHEFFTLIPGLENDYFLATEFDPHHRDKYKRIFIDQLQQQNWRTAESLFLKSSYEFRETLLSITSPADFFIHCTPNTQYIIANMVLHSDNALVFLKECIQKQYNIHNILSVWFKNSGDKIPNKHINGLMFLLISSKKIAEITLLLSQNYVFPNGIHRALAAMLDSIDLGSAEKEEQKAIISRVFNSQVWSPFVEKSNTLLQSLLTDLNETYPLGLVYCFSHTVPPEKMIAYLKKHPDFITSLKWTDKTNHADILIGLMLDKEMDFHFKNSLLAIINTLPMVKAKLTQAESIGTLVHIIDQCYHDNAEFNLSISDDFLQPICRHVIQDNKTIRHPNFNKLVLAKTLGYLNTISTHLDESVTAYEMTIDTLINVFLTFQNPQHHLTEKEAADFYNQHSQLLSEILPGFLWGNLHYKTFLSKMKISRWTTPIIHFLVERKGTRRSLLSKWNRLRSTFNVENNIEKMTLLKESLSYSQLNKMYLFWWNNLILFLKHIQFSTNSMALPFLGSLTVSPLYSNKRHPSTAKIEKIMTILGRHSDKLVYCGGSTLDKISDKVLSGDDFTQEEIDKLAISDIDTPIIIGKQHSNQDFVNKSIGLIKYITKELGVKILTRPYCGINSNGNRYINFTVDQMDFSVMEATSPLVTSYNRQLIYSLSHQGEERHSQSTNPEHAIYSIKNKKIVLNDIEYDFTIPAAAQKEKISLWQYLFKLFINIFSQGYTLDHNSLTQWIIPALTCPDNIPFFKQVVSLCLKKIGSKWDDETVKNAWFGLFDTLNKAILTVKSDAEIIPLSTYLANNNSPELNTKKEFGNEDFRILQDIFNQQFEAFSDSLGNPGTAPYAIGNTPGVFHQYPGLSFAPYSPPAPSQGRNDPQEGQMRRYGFQ